MRHAITNTNYYVRVFRLPEHRAAEHFKSKRDQWTVQDKLSEVPLTGLARKILRRLGHMKLDTEMRPRNRFEEDLLHF